MKSYQSKKTVFTLIELLVKIAIIAIFVHNSIKAFFGANLSGFCFVFSVKKTVVLPSSLNYNVIISIFQGDGIKKNRKIFSHFKQILRCSSVNIPQTTMNCQCNKTVIYIIKQLFCCFHICIYSRGMISYAGEW